jgi:putative methyltransferase
MKSMNKRNILISCPNIYNSFIYLPAAWGVLKTYAETNEQVKQCYQWLDPIYENHEPEVLLKGINVEEVDVLGLSCYLWNFGLNLQLAEYIKERNPDVLVVLGGPHPDWAKTDDLFKRHPYVDLIVKNEGEHTFREILLQNLNDEKDFSKVTGLFGREFGFTGDRDFERNFPLSYYLEQKDVYESIVKKVKARGGKVFLLHETDRGCMYGCVFCNWGSATMTKLRRLPEDRVLQEIRWAGQIGIDAIENTNANFGQLERDITITREVIKANKKYGYPNDFWYSSAKSRPDRVFEIAKLLKQNNLLDFQVLALQTTDQQIMKNSGRTNLRSDRIVEFVQNCSSENIPIKVQLIRGLPGETTETWLKSIETCLDFGVVEGFQQFPWEVLPNSPAATPDYLKQWGIESVSRFSHVPRRKKNIALDPISTSEVVVSTNSYSRDEYVDMWIISIFIQVFYAQGFLRYIMQYLRWEGQMSFSHMIQVICNDFLDNPRSGAIYDKFQEIRMELKKYVSPNARPEDTLLEQDFAELPDYHALLTVEERLTYWLAKNLSSWFPSFRAFAGSRFSRTPEFTDLVEFQKSMIIDYDYDSLRGRDVHLDFDWPQYFKDLYRSQFAGAHLRQEPQSLTIFQDGTGSRFQYAMDWHTRKSEIEKRQAFLETVTGSVYTFTERNLFSFLNFQHEQRQNVDKTL